MPLSWKLCIASSKMMGYDIAFIPKLLLHNMYFHFSFLKESKQLIAENLSTLKLPCVMIRCPDPGNSKPHGCNDGNYNSQDRATSSWSPHWFRPSQVVAMFCVPQTNSRGYSLLKRHCESSERVQVALTHFLWTRKVPCSWSMDTEVAQWCCSSVSDSSS